MSLFEIKGGTGTRTRINDAAARSEEALDRKRMKQSILRAGIVLIAVLMILAIISHRSLLNCVNIRQCANDVSAVSGGGNGFPVSASGSGIIGLDEINGNVAVLTDTSFQVFTERSKQAAVRSHFMSNPAMKTAGRYAVLIDVGGTKYSLEGISDNVLSGSTENRLMSCAVAANGRFGIATQGSSYSTAMLSTVSIMDGSGKALHTWHSAECYISDIALNEDGSKLAMCGVTARDGSMVSYIIVHTVGREETLAQIEVPDIMLYSVRFSDTGAVFAIGDHGMCVLPSDYQQNEYIDFSGELCAYDFDSRAGIALYTQAVSGSGNGTLTVLDSRGKQRFRTDVDMVCEKVSIDTDGCCLLGRGKLKCFRTSGSLAGDIDTASAPSDVLLLERNIYIADGTRVDVEQFAN